MGSAVVFARTGAGPAHAQNFKLHPERACFLQRAFLDGYSKEAGIRLDLNAAFAFAYATASAQFDRWYGNLSTLPRAVLFNNAWKRNYPYALKYQMMMQTT